MRPKPLKTLNLILSLSKDEAQIHAFSAASKTSFVDDAPSARV